MCNPIKIFFDQLASEWDGMYPPVSGETLDAILDVLHIFPGCQVLDVGCGTGVLFQKLLAKGAQVTGTDLSPQMLAKAHQKFPDVPLVCGDFYQLHLHGFDRCILYNAYPHFMDKPALAAQLAAVLKPGGRFVVAHSSSRGTINGRHHGNAAAISVPLLPAKQEASQFTAWFAIDCCSETDSSYLISGVKRQ